MKRAWFAAMLCSASMAMAGVDVNTATEADLDSVRGLAPSSKARILKAREQGLFKDWADLMRRVKGIKHGTAHKLSDSSLSVIGKPFDAEKP